ncbi:MAG: D-2-hydroxyacid dehydrogenase [Defluviitaleaceae bacterium]|nr:D-2-hydroxyacid dehydrogenase [Defluviitaleaceae bacterium]
MQAIKNVLVTIDLNELQKKEIENIMPNANFTYKRTNDVLAEEAQLANIILGNVAPSLIEGSTNLKWLQLYTAGSERFHSTIPKDAILTNAVGSYGLGISEYLIGYTLMLMKKLHLYRDNQNKALWRSEGEILSIQGSKTLIIGLGDIGSEFGKRMKALSSYVIGVKRTMTEKPDYVDELYTSEDVDKLLPEADIIALAVPDTQNTKHIISKERLEKLKETAIILNVGRGSAIDTEALCDAVLEGKVLGAALDVTHVEPLPSDHRAWSVENIVITPHISGGFNLKYTRDKAASIIVENFKAYANGEKLQNVVNLEIGY